MRRPHKQFASVALKLFAPLALGLSFLSAVYVRFYSGLLPVQDLPAWPAYAAYFVLSVALWSALEARSGLICNCFEEASLGRWLWSLAQVDFLTLALVSLAAFFWRGYSFSRYTVAGFWTLHFLLCAAAALALRAWVRGKAAGAAAPRPWIFVVGDGAAREAVRRECFPGEPAAMYRDFPDCASVLEALENFAPPAECGEVVVAVHTRGAPALGPLAQALERLPVPASVAVAGLSLGEVRSTPSFLFLSTNPQAAAAFDYVFSKRLLDVVVSLLGLAALAPLLAAIGLVTWVRSRRPVLLAQERVGRGGRRFRLYKFRTLPVSSLAHGDREWSPPPADGWGRFLRSTGLDELPQLCNVLKGEMSLVGPRPERPYFVEQFRSQLPFYSTRHRFQVGITGWAQVNGWRGDTSIPRRVEHDLYYLRHWSLALDFRILWMTLTDFLRQCRAATVRQRFKESTNARSV